MAATAIPIPCLAPCNPPPPAQPQHASGGTSQALPSQAGLQAESIGTSGLAYQISSADLVTVSSFKPSVHVMSTKTRPKRIGIVGSDGRTYTFLLKVSCLLILSACYADASYYKQGRLLACVLAPTSMRCFPAVLPDSRLLA